MSNLIPKRHRRFILTLVAVFPLSGLNATFSDLGAQQTTESSATGRSKPHRDGPFLVEPIEQGSIMLSTMEMTIHPKAEPRPSLKYQFFPDSFESVEGNSAIFYLKAQGFLEQSGARSQLQEMYQKAAQEANARGVDLLQVPPFQWQEMSPGELPIEEVKNYLALTSFQTPFLAEAARRRLFSLDRNLRNQENPIAYLLPEITEMRTLARTQSIRCRLAIAEGRLQDAFDILGQQFAMANHLGADDFLVSNLVGIATASIAWRDALYLVQHRDAPNFYWAIASLPNPLVSIERGMAFERQLLYQQIKALREVDETPRPAPYWRDFIDRVFPAFKSLEEAGYLRTNDPELDRSAFVAAIGAAYPGAKRFLLEDLQMDRAKVEAYPTAQVVFLALCRFYDRARDDHFKWNAIPFDRTGANPSFQKLDQRFREECDRVGWGSFPAHVLLPASHSIKSAQLRLQQTLAFLQTVEAIRIYGAEHQGRLPQTLEELSVPAPNDPFTGKPLDYVVKNDKAHLTGHRLPGLQYRLILQLEKGSQ